MSQFAHSSTEVIRSHRNVVLATLLALVATGVVVLILAIGSDSSDSTPANVGVSTSQPVSHPDEGTVSQAMTGSSSSTTADNRPDESSVGQAVNPSKGSAIRPDESTVGNAISQP